MVLFTGIALVYRQVDALWSRLFLNTLFIAVYVVIVVVKDPGLKGLIIKIGRGNSGNQVGGNA
jgi:hypothetical protein